MVVIYLGRYLSTLASLYLPCGPWEPQDWQVTNLPVKSNKMVMVLQTMAFCVLLRASACFGVEVADLDGPSSLAYALETSHPKCSKQVCLSDTRPRSRDVDGCGLLGLADHLQ